MHKHELRKTYLGKRKALSSQEIGHRSNAIKERMFEDKRFEEYKHVHTFLSIERHQEIDTWPIIHELSANNRQVVISSCNMKELSMDHFLWHKDIVLEESKFGIPEPVGAEGIHPEKIDLVIVPLLAFDKKGYRVGYGKGIYDRFLSTCRKDVMKVGICVEEPVDYIADTDKYDVPLDYCITPNKIYKF